MDRINTGWHLDKNVPISIIGAMIIQLACAVWFVGKMDARITALEASVMVQHERDDRQDKTSSESFTLVREDIKEVKSMVARLIDRGAR